MSEPERFLSRWARLKHEAANECPAPEPETAADDKTGSDAAERDSAPVPADASSRATPAPPACDLSTLPPIESITAATDIRPFLAPGVPNELTRAALRRAWVADPKIRDFVGIAENQWDFTAPDSILGFGPLGPLDDVRRLVAQVFGESEKETGDAVVSATAKTAPDASEPEVIASAACESLEQIQDSEKSTAKGDREAVTQRSEVDVAMQHEETNREYPEAPIRPRHGGALPQ